jgi:hypothetical protein
MPGLEGDEDGFPLTWYAAKRLCPRKKLFEDYIRENAAPETLQFLQRLEEWRNCQGAAAN